MCHFDQKTILKTLQYDTLAGIGGICQLYWIRIKTKYIFLKHSPPHPSSRFIQISFCIGSRSNLTHPYTYDIQTLTIWSYTSFSYVGKIHKWSNTDFAFTFSLRRRLLGRLQNQKKRWHDIKLQNSVISLVVTMLALHKFKKSQIRIVSKVYKIIGIITMHLILWCNHSNL